MAQFNKSYGGVAKSSRGGRGGRGARVVSVCPPYDFERDLGCCREQQGNSTRLFFFGVPPTDDGILDQNNENKEPPWFEWKISNVEAEAGRAKEQLDKFKAIYKGHVERLAELEDKKEESKKDEKEE
ncbi:hypothetical protein PG996_012378 [Apiospora saccharicola]|uniref:Uncharacterized protein n=1 Tax=Apiospora saccharicola TaxID=335842 RepID=A0ABR1U2Z9_9PEZI